MVQGGSVAFLVPSIAILKLDKWKCPTQDYIDTFNLTSEEVWQPRMREVSLVVWSSKGTFKIVNTVHC